MARSIPPDRFAALLSAGTAMFVTHGYQRTQMQDVADAMGVAKGTVYAVVSSKEALLLACLRFADDLEDAPHPEQWPLPSPAPGELIALVTDRLGAAADLALHRLGTTPAGSPANELEVAVLDLMRVLQKHRRAIKLVDRCAPEIPELATLWFGAGRAHLVGRLVEHLALRAEQGQVALNAAPPHWDVVARTIVETCVLWAVHLPWDPAPEEFRSTRPTDEVARVLASLFTTGLVPDTSGTQSTPPSTSQESA